MVQLCLVALTRQLCYLVSDEVDMHYQDYNVYKSLDAIMTQLRNTNVFVQRHQPWLLCKEPGKLPLLQNVLHIIMETLRVAGILLQPVVPSLADNILKRLNVPMCQRTCENLTDVMSEDVTLGDESGALFPRIK